MNFGTTFFSNNFATVHSNNQTNTVGPFPDQAVTSISVGSSFFEANALTDPEPIATTQVTAATAGGPSGHALAQSLFFQTFNLSANGVYTYNFLTGISSTYFNFDPEGAVSGYSKAQYALGWWDQSTSSFVPGNFVQSVFFQTPIGQADVDVALFGFLTFNFDSNTAPTGALPAFGAVSESFAQVVPLPSTMFLLGSGLRVAGYRRKKFLESNHEKARISAGRCAPA